MGNNNSKHPVNFFDEIKMSTSYRDFVMKMTSILSQKDVDWSINLTKIHQDEINMYWDLINHIFVFTTEFIFEESIQKKDIEPDKANIIKTFLDILQKLITFVLQVNPERLYGLLWVQIDQELSVEPILENGFIVKAKVDGKDFIGGEDQLPIFLKLLIAISNLLFKNNFALTTNEIKYEKFAAIVAQQGWLKFQKSNDYVGNRIVLLEFLFVLLFTEKKFIKIKSSHSNSVVRFLKSSKQYQGLFRSLLFYGTNYNENGVLPYSAYFFKDFMENSLYFSALSINLSIIFLEDETHLAKLEKVNDTNILPAFLIKNYLANQGLSFELDEENILEDEPFMLEVLQKIVNNIMAYIQKSKALLPNSLKEVF